MDLREAAQRVLRGHAALLIVCVVLAMGGAGFLHRGDVRLYKSSTRILLETGPLKSALDAQSQADTARAVVTSEAHVKRTLKKVKLDRDAATVAQNRIRVDPLSGVLVVSAEDPSPHGAARLADGLASDLVDTYGEATSRGRAERDVADVTQRIAVLNTQLASLDTQIDFAVKGVPAGGGDLQQLRGKRADLAGQIANLEARLTRLNTELVLKNQPTIIARATIPKDPQPTGLVQDLALAALIGLVIGVAVSALFEMLRPRVVGARAVAAQLETVLIERLHTNTSHLETWDPAPAAFRIRLAADAASVRGVQMVGVGPDARVGKFAERIDTKLAAMLPPADADADANPPAEPRTVPKPPTGGKLPTRGSVPTSGEVPSEADNDAPRPARLPTATSGHYESENGDGGATPFALHVAPFGTDTGTADGTAGMVVVAPETVTRSELDRVRDLRSLTGWSVLGVITYSAGRRQSRRSRARENEPV